MGGGLIAQLLWRCPANRILPPLKELPDGSYLSELKPTQGTKAQARERAISVRVIEYALPGWLMRSRATVSVQRYHLDAPAPW